MKVRAGFVVLVLFVGMVAGCGDDDEAAATSAPTTTAATTAPTATTTTVTSTTTSTTTTTVPPWTTMPDNPDRPFALIPQGDGYSQVSKMCVSAETTGVLSPSNEVMALLEESLGYILIEVVPDGCEASFDLKVDGYRRSGTYTNFGTCWVGIAINGTSTLSVGGEVVAEGSISLPGQLPDTIFGCPDREQPVEHYSWAGELIAAPLLEAFGPLGEMAAGMGFSTDRISTGRVSADEMQAMASMLSVADVDLLKAVDEWAKELAEERAADLFPLIPYLIVLFGDDELAGEARAAIHHITGYREWDDTWPRTQRLYWSRWGYIAESA